MLRQQVEEAQLTHIVESVIGEVNIDLSRFEQIKKFRVLPHDLTEESGELTPTLKVKRRVVAEKFAYLIDEMYD